MKRIAIAAVAAAAIAVAHAQHMPNPQEMIAVQREALKPLAIMDGAWRGPAWTLQPNGEKRHITQTERGDTDWPLGTPVPQK